MPTDGRLTSLDAFSGTMAADDLLLVVSPGNAASGINYKITAADLAAAMQLLGPIVFPTSLTSGGVLYASSTTQVACSSLLAAQAVVVGGGAGTAPSTIASTPTSGYVLVAQGAGVAPVWAHGSTVSTLVIGTTTVTGGATTRILYDNAGVLGEYTITGTGTVVAMQTSPRFITDIAPTANDGAALGTTALSWSDLSLASGGVINWNAGNVTLTHAANAMTLADATFAVNNTNTTNGVSVLAVNKDWASSSSTNLMSVLTSYGDSVRFTIRQAGGTQASPTQTTNTTTLGNINWRGYTNSGAFTTTDVAQINCIAAESFTSAANGADLGFVTTPIGSTTSAQVFRLFANGGAIFGSSATSPGAGVVSIAATTASTSTSTGALVVSGGVGVAGAIWAGSVIRSQAPDGGYNFYGFSSSGAAGFFINSANTVGFSAQSNDSAGGFAQIGTTTAHNLILFRNNTSALTLASGLIRAESAFAVSITSTTASTSTTTGALVVSGGVGMAGALYGGNKISSVHATAGVGYSTGAGGAVTQGTSRTTGVTLNKVCGQITLVSAAGSATPASFTVTNSAVAATDTIILNQVSGTDDYILLVTAVGAGSFEITFYTTGGTTTEQPVINFSIIKAVAA